MNREVIISSTANPKVREVLALEKPRERRESGLFVIEGIKEIDLAIKTGYEIAYFIRCPDLHPSGHRSEIFKLPEWLVSVNVYSKLAMRENSGGLLAVANMKPHSIDEFQVSENSLFIVLEAVEKPGNLGAVLRTADAAGVSGVIICDPRTDIYNPNVVRSSLGALFTVPVAITDSISAIRFLQKNNTHIYCTHLNASVPYDTVDYCKSSAIIMGTESTGLSDNWTQAATSNIIIPMAGQIDSMNVSVSAAIVTFEAIRQRRNSGSR
ncbi:MAG: TrmH family RNA methyltransferase [Cyclobacteriaceae bacterium]